LLTPPETAALIGEVGRTHITVDWVHEQRHAGRLAAVVLSPKKIRFRRADVLDFIERSRVPAATSA
jgi:hypothetical protein